MTKQPRFTSAVRIGKNWLRLVPSRCGNEWVLVVSPLVSLWFLPPGHPVPSSLYLLLLLLLLWAHVLVHFPKNSMSYQSGVGRSLIRQVTRGKSSVVPEELNHCLDFPQRGRAGMWGQKEKTSASIYRNQDFFKDCDNYFESLKLTFDCRTLPRVWTQCWHYSPKPAF